MVPDHCRAFRVEPRMVIPASRRMTTCWPGGPRHGSLPVGFRLLSVTLSPVLPFLPLNTGPAPGHGDTALITSVAPQHSAGRAPPPGSCCTSSGFTLPIPGASTQGSATFVACRCPPRLRPTYTPSCQARPLWPHAACTLPVSGLRLLRTRHAPPRRDPVSHPRCC